MTRALDETLLRGRTLGTPEGGKDVRGSVAVVGGSREVPGAVLLAGIGALRAGAGRLQVVSVASRAEALSMALPEALVMGLPETEKGGLSHECFELFAERLERADAVLFGPGTVEEDDTRELARRLIGEVDGPTLVLDAGSLNGLRDCADALRRRGRFAITPHAGEMAGLLGIERDQVEEDPLGAARGAAEELGGVVVMKGAKTHVVAPGGEAFLYEGGGPGLGTSGSGDVLAGIVAGMAARGASALDAALWGVFLHGEAGAECARSVGTVGFLAHELLPQVPGVLMRFER
ncbi:MAG: NAD(P)H-hydrate dehydratase [Mesorhizobium amorphae]|nr:MAG: NAD(P)H-hydrate dehydratase [Mesorhizobium amorphae]